MSLRRAARPISRSRRLTLEALEPKHLLDAASAVLTGDVNLDGVLDAADIDLLYDHVYHRIPGGGIDPPASTANPADVTGNGTVNECDVRFLVHNVFQTEFGDGNLDRKVNGQDAADLAHNYGRQGSGWAGGDYDGNQVTDLADLAVSQQFFGFAPTSLAPGISPPLWNAFLESSRTPYSENERESADSWVIGWGCPHAATQTDDLVDLLGNDAIFPVSGAPGVYVWQPPEDVTADQITSLLSPSGDVEFFYPNVPAPAELNAVPNDPLYGRQWHLSNAGQFGGTVGVDANVEPVWDTYRGRGVVIGIVDDGLQYAHPDLSPHYEPSLSHDYDSGDADPAPRAGSPCSLFVAYDCHGTAVAGVAAAAGFNGVGVAGAAPEAHLAGLRLISGEGGLTMDDAKTARALLHESQQIDIYNNSWGLGGAGQIRDRVQTAQTLAAMEEGAQTGRGGLGSIYVWAAGNGNALHDNVNYDRFAKSRHAIAVAAVDNLGIQSYYSTPGAAVLVAAPSSGSNANAGITTTDLMGSDGYNCPSTHVVPLTDQNFTCAFGGTSSAAPLVSGVIALMLEANPNLGYRDVQAILIESARMNDPSDADWVTNDAGLHVNHKYGFGLIDAQAAVALATSWTNLATQVGSRTYQDVVNLPIRDNDATGLSRTIRVMEDINVEWVEVELSATHNNRGDLEVVLTSPNGTESRLAEQRIEDAGDNYTNWLFTSVRHWGESSLGDWTLTVRDKSSGFSGTFDKWTLNVYGTAAGPEIEVSCAGVVIPDDDRTPSTDDCTDFGESEIGVPTPPRTFTISNHGERPLQLTGSSPVRIVGTASVDFEVVTQPPSIIPVGGSADFAIVFRPTQPGQRNAILVVENNDADESFYDFAVTGRGTPQPQLPPRVVSPIRDLEVNEDAPPHNDYVDLNDVFFDSRFPDTALVYSIVSVEGTPGVVNVSIDANDRLDLTFAANGFGKATIRVQAENPLGFTGLDEFDVTVHPVNDVPSFAAGPNVSANEGSGFQDLPWATSISAGPVNESDQTLTFLVVSNSNPGLFASGPIVTPDGRLQFISTPGVIGDADIGIVLRDSGGTSRGGMNTSGMRFFRIEVTDATVPSAVANATNITTPGPGSHAFGVTYADNVAIDVDTIGASDVRVTGPNGYDEVASLDGVDLDANGTPRTATYRVPAPGGTWDATDNGEYEIEMLSDEVSDTSGNFVPAGPIGSFQVDIGTQPPPASIAGQVWRDLNANGIRDVGEAGAAGAVVTVFTAVGEELGRIITDSTGAYGYSNLDAGAYYVEFAPPAGFMLSPQDRGTDDSLDSDPSPITGRTNVLTLAADQHLEAIDAGVVVEPAQIRVIWASTGPTAAIQSTVVVDGTTKVCPSECEDVVTRGDLPQGLVDPNDVAIDPINETIYWTDRHPTSPTAFTIWTANLDGSNARGLIELGGSPDGLTIDPAAGKLYWADNQDGAIYEADIDGQNAHALITGQSLPEPCGTPSACHFPYDVAVDTLRGEIFWTDAAAHKIRRANLDGTGIEDVVSGLGTPTGVVVDAANGKVYWSDVTLNVIRRANLDGTGAEEIASGLDYPNSLALDPARGFLYWGEFGPLPNRIRRVNVDGPTRTIEDVATGIVNPFGVALLVRPVTTQIRGTKFNDLDGNGVRTAGEMGLVGWTIYVDVNNNGQLDAGEPNDVTDADGNYAISDLSSGTHTVREMQQPGWTQTFPRTGFGGSGQLSSVQTLPVPSDSIAISNDGRHLYAAEEDESRLSVYARDGVTGELAHVQTIDGVAAPWAIAESPDGENVYASLRHIGAIGVFARNRATGELTLVESFSHSALIQPRTLKFDANGEFLYIASPEAQSIVVVRRNATTGTLTYVHSAIDPTPIRNSLNSVSYVDLSPDGRFAYATGSSNGGVATFARDSATGMLTFVEELFDGDTQGASTIDGILGPQAVRVSPDGMHVYVAGNEDQAVAVFVREIATGRLTYVQTVAQGGDVSGLIDVLNLTLSPDGDHLYTVSDATSFAAAFRRDRITGKLTFLESYDGQTVAGLNRPTNFVPSPDGDYLYVGHALDTVSVFRRDHAPALSYVVTVASAEIVRNVDFSNRRTSAEIHGTKFNDLDGDGVRDADESGLPGWTIYADLNENGQFDAGEPSDVTDANGGYLILVPPGTYTVREVGQTGWTQTSPGAGFALAGSFTTGFNPEMVAAADIDGDGILDLVTANHTTSNNVSFGNTVSFLPGDGKGAVGAAVTLTVGTGPDAIVAVDLDNDGKPDAATANYVDGNVTLLWNNRASVGELAFVRDPVSPTVGSVPWGIAAADLDGDQRLDLVVGNANSGGISILRNLGNRQFAAAVNIGTGNAPRQPTIADFDDDGDLDLAIPHVGSGNIAILINNGSGQFTASQLLPAIPCACDSFPINSVEAHAAPAGDLDGDGDLDLAVVTVQAPSNKLAILFNQGDGTFSPPDEAHTYDAGVHPRSVTMLDADRDGDLDLAVTVRGRNFDGERDQTVTVWLNDGVGNFGPPLPYMVGNGPVWIIVADMNDDGADDLVTSNEFTDDVSVLLNRSGVYRETVVAGDQLAGRDFGNRFTGGFIRGMKFNDLDGDGVRDTGEPGLEGWTIYVDLNNDGFLTPDEPSDGTDSSGRYTIPVPLGTYMVREVSQPGWHQTSPDGDGGYLVRVGGDPTLNVFGFSASSYSTDTAAMDTVLGVESYNVENFDDESLIPGLEVEFDGPIYSLPGSVPSSAIMPAVPGLDWAGTNGNALRNNIDSGTTDVVTLRFPEGARSVGFGISEVESGGHTLRINATTSYTVVNLPSFTSVIGDIPQFMPGDRAVYIRIDVPEGGVPIYSVSIDRTTRTVMPGDESFYIDHVTYVAAGAFGNRQISPNPSAAAAGALVVAAVDRAMSDNEPGPMIAERSHVVTRHRIRLSDRSFESAENPRHPERRALGRMTLHASSHRRAVSRSIAAEMAVDGAFSFDGTYDRRAARRIVRS